MAAIGSQAFSGEETIVSILPKGETGSQMLTGRLTGVSSSGFNRSISQEKTFGTSVHKVSGYGPTTVTMNFVLDADVGSPLSSFFGDQTASGDLQTVTLRNSVQFYKIKLEFSDYNGTFGQAGTSDLVMKEIFYNAYSTSLNTNASADGQVVASMTFAVFPFNGVGSSNYVEMVKPVGENIATIETQEATFDTLMGY